MEIGQDGLQSELGTLLKELDGARVAKEEAEALKFELAAARRDLEDARRAKHVSGAEAQVLQSMDPLARRPGAQEELAAIHSQLEEAYAELNAARAALGEAQKARASLTAEAGQCQASGTTCAGSGAADTSVLSTAQLGGDAVASLSEEVLGEDGRQLKQLLGKLPIALVDNRTDTMETFSANGTKYVIKALLGEGGFGSVYRCSPDTENQRNRETAVKIINIVKLAMMTGCSHSTLLVRMLQEVQILQCLGRHDHIVQMHWAGVSKDPLCVFIGMELMTFGNLFNELVRRRRPFSEGEAREVATQLTEAVRHCHMHDVAHRDIKLENIMIAGRDPLCIKLCDYGQAKLLQNVESRVKDTTAKTLTTTQLYTPPEVQHAIQNNAAYDAFKADAYGVGVVLYGILCSALPDAAKGQNYEKNGNWLQLSAAGQDLVRQLLHPDPSQRLTVEMVRLHPWSRRCPSPARPATPSDFDSELQALLAAQSVNRALQTERGASCWMLASSSGVPEHRWRCKLTTSRFDDAEEKVSTVQGACWVSLRETLHSIRDETEILRRFCQDAAMRRGSPLGADDFDFVFRKYSELNQVLVVTLGNMVMTLRGPGPCGRSEIRHCLLLIIAEQLGRERAFLSGHISQSHRLYSLPVLLRFAKIQGSRQALLGSCSPSLNCEVVTANSGLMPALQLSEDCPLNEEDMRALEEAETHVMEGKTGTHEWFALLTKLIDKVHAHISVGLVEFFDKASLSRSNDRSRDHSLKQEDSGPEDKCGALPSMPMKVDPNSLSTPEVTPIHYSLRKPVANITSIAPSEIAQWGVPQRVPHAAPGKTGSQKETKAEEVPAEGLWCTGTIGHPTACSGIGCKFYRSPRGCKAGLACTRCHLCLWTRSYERKRTQASRQKKVEQGIQITVM